MELIKDNNLNNVLVTGGGIIPEEDAEDLSNLGVGKLFGPGTPVKESLDYIKSWVKERQTMISNITNTFIKAKKLLILHNSQNLKIY